MSCLVPSDVDKAMVHALYLLQKNMPTDPDKHEERFHFFFDAAVRAPFVVLEESTNDSQSWSNRTITVENVLCELLPKLIMDAIKPQLPTIQNILDGVTKIRGFDSFFYDRQQESKHIVQLCFKRIVPHTHRLEVYFVEINATFDGARFTIVSSTTNDLKVRFFKQTFSVNTEFLMADMKSNPAQLEEEMRLWEETTKSICNSAA